MHCRQPYPIKKRINEDHKKNRRGAAVWKSSTVPVQGTKSTLYDTSVAPFCQIIAGSLQHPTIEYILNKNVNTCEYAIMGQNVMDLGT